MHCINCGAQYSKDAVACPACGQPNPNMAGKKNKAVFVVLAIFFGAIGVHRFYLGNIGLGVLYLLFFWTMIPAIVALLEALVIGLRKDDRFSS